MCMVTLMRPVDVGGRWATQRGVLGTPSADTQVVYPMQGRSQVVLRARRGVQGAALALPAFRS